MKVAELQGPLLDYWVGRAAGIGTLRTNDRITQALDTRGGFGGGTWVHWSPSTDWAVGGPIIQQEPFGIFEKSGEEWSAGVYAEQSSGKPLCVAYCSGTTILQSAMRTYVTSKFGETVGEVPIADRIPFGMMG